MSPLTLFSLILLSFLLPFVFLYVLYYLPKWCHSFAKKTCFYQWQKKMSKEKAFFLNFYFSLYKVRKIKSKIHFPPVPFPIIWPPGKITNCPRVTEIITVVAVYSRCFIVIKFSFPGHFSMHNSIKSSKNESQSGKNWIASGHTFSVDGRYVQ